MFARIQANEKLDFTSFFQVEDILPDMKSTTKREALAELSAFLCKRKKIENQTLIQRRVAERENLESTGLGHGIAFPHARLELDQPVELVLGRIPSGIDYGAIDEKPVKIIFMAVWKPDFPGLFHQIFGGLVEFLRVPDYREELFNAPSAEKLYQIITESQIKMTTHHERVNKANILYNLQNLEAEKKEREDGETRGIDRKINLLRAEVSEQILHRFDRLVQRTGIAVVPVQNGACQSCFMQLSSGAHAMLKRGTDIMVCENCGHFIIDGDVV